MVSCTHGQRLGRMATKHVRVRDGAFRRALGLAAICFAVLVQPQGSSASDTVNVSLQARAAFSPAKPLTENIDRLIDTLLAWIVAESELQAPNPPRVILLPRQKMIAMYYGAEEVSEHRNLQAFYIPTERTIYLPDTWLHDELYGRSILLHELVHHVQRSNNVRVPCPAALERQAYELQTAWLREQGVASPYEMIGTDEFTVRILSSCATDD